MDVHIVNASSEGSSPQFIQQVLAVSTRIFYDEGDNEEEPLERDNSANDVNQWIDKVENRRGEIAFIKSPDDDQIAAFTFTFERTDEGNDPVLHIWIAGCLRKYRRLGYMTHLFRTLLDRARLAGYPRVTVNTYPNRFVHMPTFLGSQGFRVYKKIAPGAGQSPMTEKWQYELRFARE